MRSILPSSVLMFWPLPMRVAAAPAVAEADVEVPVGPEQDVAAVVVGVGLVDEEHAPGRRSVRAVAAHRVLDHVRVAIGVGVVDVQVRAVGRERDAEQALLAPARRLCREVEDRSRIDLAVADGDDLAGLLREIERVVAGPDRHRERLRELGDRHQADRHLTQVRRGRRRRNAARAARGARRRRARRRRQGPMARAGGGDQREREQRDRGSSHAGRIRPDLSRRSERSRAPGRATGTIRS